MPIDVDTWSETPASNTAIDGVSIAENATALSAVNNALRAIMAGVKTFRELYDGGAAAAVTLTGTQALSNKTLASPVITGTARETVYTIPDAAAYEITPANGSIQLWTLTASRTPKGTNFANGDSITLGIDDGTAFAITWTDATFGATGVKWLGGSAPALSATGLTWVTLWKVAGQVYGTSAGSSA